MSTQTSASSDTDEKNLKASSLFSVDGLIAVVTGGGTGIGLMAAKALAVNGAKVYIVGRREETLKKTAEEHGGGRLIPLAGDVTSKDSIQQLVAKIKEKEGCLDLLVNNAGISGPKHEIHEDKSNAEHVSQCLWEGQKFEEWGELYATNVSSIYFTSVAFLPLLQEGTKRKKGYSSSILNISSISGLIKVSQNHLGYNSSKAAAIHLTKLMATEFADTKVRVNTIAPGLFPSEMTAEESDEKNVSELDRKMDVPAGRPGDIKDMAGPVLLLSSKAGLYMNGVVIPVDGGYLLKEPSTY